MGNVLERRQETASPGAGAAGLVAAADRGGDRRPPRDGQRYLKAAGIAVRGRGGRPADRPPKPAITRRCPPTPARQNRPFRGGVHRLGPAKTGHHGGGVHRLWRRSPRPGRAPSASACEPYRELIAEALGAWPQRDGDLAGPGRRPRLHARGTRASGASCVTLRGSAAAEARVVIITAPGEEAQVDYGDGPMVRDPADRQVPPHAALRADARLHAQVGAAADVAVERADLGRAARARVSPPRRRGARRRPRQSAGGRPHARHLRPDAQSALSRRARALRRRRAAVPRRRSRSQGQGRSRRRPRAEDAAQGLRFETLEEAQAYLDRWEERWADTRIHGTTKRQVAAMFAEEQPALRPLPLEPFRYYRFGVRTVHLDGCVEVEARLLRRAARAGSAAASQCSGTSCTSACSIRTTGQLLREHLRAPPRLASHRRTRIARRARRRSTLALLGARARAPARTSARSATRSTARRRSRASGASSACSPSPGSTAPRPSRTPRRPRSSSACPRYRFVRRYLERRPPVPLTLRQVDPLIRQLTLYRDLIDRTTGDPT